jgi:hypothetical protein
MTLAKRGSRKGLLALGLVTLLGASPAVARPNLAMEPFQGRKIRIDGSLGDWPAHLEKLDIQVQGTGSEASALLGYDNESLYFAIKANSKDIVRKSKPGPGQDHATVELLVPGGPGAKSYPLTLEFYPGDPGKLEGAILVNGKTVTEGEIVEFQKEDSFELEARVPWSALPGTHRVRTGLRGRISFFDAGPSAKITRVASTSDKGTLIPLTSFAETGLIEVLVGEKGLRPTPAREAYGELTGQGTLERVALYGNLLTIVGPDYRGGQEFFASPLDVSEPSQVVRLELFDFNRDGKDEIVIEKRISPSSTDYRQVVSVLEVSSDGVPSEIFLAEVALVTKSGKVQNELTLSRKEKEPALIVAQGKHSGFEEETFREPRLGEGIPSAILPWEPIQSRRYVYRGHRLELALEVPAPSRSVKGAKPKSEKADPRPTSVSSAAGIAKAPSSNLDRLFALYKKSKPNSGPIRVEIWEDVAEDERPERIVWQDKDIVVLGEGFQSGTKFAAVTLPVKESDDVLSVSLLEVTGDNKLDIVVHALIHAKAGDVSKSEAVVRQVILLYNLQGGRLVPIFSAEVGRALGNKQIVSGFRVFESGGSKALELASGRAIGFTAKTYPFPEDPNPEQPKGATIRPILLPWGTTKSRRFTFSAGELREQ